MEFSFLSGLQFFFIGQHIYAFFDVGYIRKEICYKSKKRLSEKTLNLSCQGKMLNLLLHKRLTEVIDGNETEWTSL